MAKADVGILESRQAIDLPVVCPAGVGIGEKLEGCGCRCRVTDSDVLSGTDPNSLIRFCLAAPFEAVEITTGEKVTGGYTLCRAWRDDKERAWAGRPSVLDEKRGRAAQSMQGAMSGFLGI